MSSVKTQLIVSPLLIYFSLAPESSRTCSESSEESDEETGAPFLMRRCSYTLQRATVECT